MIEPDGTHGTTRRALLRTSALGVGALVGGAALVTADATEADAAGSRRQILLTLDGVTGDQTVHGLHGAIVVRGVTWSLNESVTEVTGDVMPSLVVLTMRPGRASSALLARLLNGHVSHTGKIRTYSPNIAGQIELASTITLTEVHVVGFHQAMTGLSSHGPGGLLDTVKLTYATLEFDEDNFEATYSVIPP